MVAPVRGNVNTRLDKLDAGEYDALLLAGTGLQRLGLADRIREFLSLDDSLPAAGQGALGVECSADRTDVIELLRPLNDSVVTRCVAPSARSAVISARIVRCRSRRTQWTRMGELQMRALIASSCRDSRVAMCGLRRRFRCARGAGGGRTASTGRG